MSIATVTALPPSSNHPLQPDFNLDNIRDQLHNLYGKPIPEKRAFVEWLTSKEIFPQFIDAICNDDDLLQEIADRSFPHKNGFDMFKLFKTDEYDLRAHIWPDTLPPSQENIHCHRWDLASRILVGALRQDIFVKVSDRPVQRTFLANPAIREEAISRRRAAAKEANEPFEEPEEPALIERQRFACAPNKNYHKEQDSNGRTLPYSIVQVTEATSDTYLLKQIPHPDSQVKAGRSYGLDRTVFHRVVRKVGDGTTATLMLNTGPHSPASQVFSTRTLTHEEECEAFTYTPAQVKSKLQGLLALYQQAN